MNTPAIAAEPPTRAHVGRLLGVATTLHRQGSLHEAEELYCCILSVEPGHVVALNDLGNTLLALGRCNEAITRYQQAIAIRPDYPEALSNLGNALHVSGRPQEAIACYARALALDPDYAAAHNNFGNSLHALGRPEEALPHFARAMAIEPASAEFHCNAGIVLSALGRRDEAVACFERSLAIKPDHADGHRNLADTLLALGRHADAIAHYRKALDLRPDYAEARSNLANLLQQIGRIPEAIVEYRRALAIRPDYADAHCNLGDALLSLGRAEEAIGHFQRAIAIDPDRAVAHHHLGIALQAVGRLPEAHQAYERAVRLAPGEVRFHLNLASARPFAAGDPRLAALETLAQNAGALGADDRIMLHFAMAKALADLGQHERSFRHLLEGNGLKRRQVAYDEAETLRIFERIRCGVTGELMRAKQGGGDPSAAPVFVIGMPRSGTTLVEQILASHSKVFAAGEVEDFGATVSNFARSRHPSHGIVELLPTLSGEDLRRIGADYLARIRPAAGAAERIVNKLPSNFLFVGVIHLVLPNARIIHTVRDPVDTCFSNFSLLFAETQAFAYDLGELGRYYNAYDGLIRHWRSVLPPGVMIDVRYEDVVDDLEGTARRIVAHCGLDWEDACLAFHQARRPVRTASSAQVRQPIYRSSVGRWRPYRELLRPLLDALDVESSR